MTTGGKWGGSPCLGIVIVSLLAWGCAGVAPAPRPTPPAAVETESAPRGWWYVRFIRDWPEGLEREPEWHLDLLIANEILAPALRRREAGIPLWRLHRRAGHDAAGHALSLIVYATPATADALCGDIRSTPLVVALTASGRVDRVTCEDTADLKRPEPQDASDKAWPLEIQKAWPHFIMGVSRTWLDLVSQKAAEFGGNPPPPGCRSWRPSTAG